MLPIPQPYPHYKPSHVEWLGDIPAHWEVRRGKQLFQKMERPVREDDEVVTCFRDGVVTLRKNRREDGFTESLKEIGYQGIRRGDLVIHAMDAFAGAIGVSDSDGKGTPVYSVCEPAQQANAYYHAYILREMSRNRWIEALAKGIRERSSDFRYSEFGSQILPLPPLPEQRAIVRYLDHVDDRIRRYVSAKEKLIALLEEERQAVIHRAVTRGLDPNVPLKPSGVEWLGDVPAHWEVKKIKHLARSDHKSFVDGDWIESPYPVFPILGVFRLNGQSKRDDGMIFGSCKASQSPVYPIRDAFLAVNHASCPSLSSSGLRQWGESALKTSRLPGALSLLAKSWLYPPSTWRRR